METNGEGLEGNTITSKPKRINQLKVWFFTFNNYTHQNIIDMETKFREICIKYIFQEETGENGTPHLQGVILLKKSMRWSEFKLPKEIHWEKCIDFEASVKYCSKEETRTGNIYQFGFPKPLKIIEQLRDWQVYAEKECINEPDGRTCHWVFDEIGNSGKSAFCKYMYVKHNALVIQGGKLADIMNVIFNSDMEKINCVIIDIPRNNKNKVSYSSIECILNGMITNTKYETGVKVFNPPVVMVLSNFPPEKDKLSLDRWNIKEIINHKIEPYDDDPFNDTA